MVAPDLWRRMFAHSYGTQFALARSLGLDVWFHSCGNIGAILGDMHSLGVDVMNISQPNTVDTAAAGALLRGSQCFMVPVSYQTVSITGTREEIFGEARRLYRDLGTLRGGFIGYVEEYGSIGMSAENYRACIDAFGALNS